MKIFAKRKRTSNAADNNKLDKNAGTSHDGAADSSSRNTPSMSVKSSTQEPVVSSYFSKSNSFATKSNSSQAVDSTLSANKKRKKEVLTEIEQLLQMDYSQLNAKQRRLLKRYQERQKEEGEEERETQKNETQEKIGDDVSLSDLKFIECQNEERNGKKSDNKVESDKSKAGNHNKVFDKHCSSSSKSARNKDSQPDQDSTDDCDGRHNKKANGEKENKTSSPLDNLKEKQPKTDTTNDIGVIVTMQFTDLNSKQRRLLKRYHERCGIQPVEEGKSEEGSPSNNQLGNGNSRNISVGHEKNSGIAVQQEKEGANKPKKSSKVKDWSDLPKEERERRARQKQMQKDAAEQRSLGLEDASSRHPLNSERRRANRRKPGKSGRIAEAKKKARKLAA